MCGKESYTEPLERVFAKMLPNKDKLLYINNIRILLIILVVMIHISITYGGSGSWYYHEPTDDTLSKVLLTLFNAVSQSFVLGFFFMIAGYFTPSSYSRKGMSKFIKDRLLRLGVPFLFYFFIISPIMTYILYIKVLKKQLLWYQLFGSGPLWFAEALLIMTVFYALWRRNVQKEEHQSKAFEPPGHKQLLIYVSLLSAANFIIRIWWPMGADFSNLQFGFFPGYISLFIIGTIAYRKQWFESFSKAVGKRWLKMSSALIILFPIIIILGGALKDTKPFMGGLHWQSLLYSIWEAFVGTGLIAGLLVIFRDRYNHQGRLAEVMAENAFTVYIFHAPIIIFFTYMIRHITIYPIIKFALVSVLGISLCFVISHYIIRKIPFAKLIL